MKDDKLSMWAIVKVRECCDGVDLEDESRLSIAQDILRKSTDFLRRIIAPCDGVGGVTLSYVCPHCHRFSLEHYIWWVHSEGPEQSLLVVQDSADRRNPKVFLVHAAPQGMHDNMITVPKLWANQQKYDDNPFRMIVPGLLEQSRRKLMDGLRLFMAVDDSWAVERNEVPESGEAKDRFPRSRSSGRRG